MCTQKIPCCAFESAISARFSAWENFFAKAWGSELSGRQLLTNPPSFPFFSFLKYPVK